MADVDGDFLLYCLLNLATDKIKSRQAVAGKQPSLVASFSETGSLGGKKVSMTLL